MKNIRNLLLMTAAAATLSACGDGGGGDLIRNDVAPSTTLLSSDLLAPGTYKLTFSAISTARLAAPISGIEVAVRFPAGLSVGTLAGGSGQILSASLIPGSSIQTTSLAYGSYSASTRTAYTSMTTTQNNFRGGEFMSLLFTVSAGTAVTANDIYALNSTFSNYRVIGFDPDTHSSVTMSGSVRTSLGVVK